MKRLVFGGLLALGLVATATPAWADCYFHSTCCRSMTFVRTCRNRCWNFSSYCNPLPCVGSYGAGYSGYAPLPAAYAPYGYPYAAVAAAPAAARPAAPAPAAQPQFKAPQPTPAANSPTGLQQAGYFYYGQTTNAGYNYGAGYGYGYYGYGAYSYAQAPNYWY